MKIQEQIVTHVREDANICLEGVEELLDARKCINQALIEKGVAILFITQKGGIAFGTFTYSIPSTYSNKQRKVIREVVDAYLHNLAVEYFKKH